MDWSNIAQGFLNSLRSAAGQRADAANEIIAQIANWGSHLAKNASERWLMAVADPQPCRHKQRPGQTCGMHALVRCDVCGNPVCLAHARIDFLGFLAAVDFGHQGNRRENGRGRERQPVPYVADSPVQ